MRAETFADKFAELVGSWCPLGLIPVSVMAEEELDTCEPKCGHSAGTTKHSTDEMPRTSSSNLVSSANAEAEWAFLEQRLESCLEVFQGSIAGMSLAPDQREQVLDDLAKRDGGHTEFLQDQ